VNETQNTHQPGRFHVDGQFLGRLWRAGAERTVVIQRRGTRYLSMPLNWSIILLALLVIGTAPMWPLVAVAVIAALVAKVEVVVLRDVSPAE